MNDQQHANAINRAATAMNHAINAASDDGLIVELLPEAEGATGQESHRIYFNICRRIVPLYPRDPEGEPE